MLTRPTEKIYLIKSYLTNKIQYVLYHGFTSVKVKNDCGVPQG